MVTNDQHGPPGDGARASDAAEGHTVFVIDDTPANVVLLQRLITRAVEDVAVHSFTDPREALAELEEALPDLVLLDLHMPVLDGFAVMERIRDLVPQGGYLPILMLTADVTAEVKQRALANGAKDFLTKPFDHAEVLLRVSNLLETRSLYRRLGQDNANLQAALDTRLVAERAAAEEKRRRNQRITAALAPGSLAMVFQPVVDLIHGEIAGVEALARFACEPRRPPNEWFEEADEVGRCGELEMAAVSAALGQLSDLPEDTFLAVNLSSAAVTTTELEQLLDDCDTRRVILELTEQTEVDDYPALLDRLERLRARGLRVAVDDTGAGYASLKRLLQIRPDVLKMDIALTRDIDTDPARRALATALVSFAQETGATIIAEGVETAEELTTLQRLGIPWGQGYYLARPQPLPLTNLGLRALVRAGRARFDR